MREVADQVLPGPKPNLEVYEDSNPDMKPGIFFAVTDSQAVKLP